MSRYNRPYGHKAKNVYHLIPYIRSLWAPNLREEGKRIGGREEGREEEGRELATCRSDTASDVGKCLGKTGRIGTLILSL